EQVVSTAPRVPPREDCACCLERTTKIEGGEGLEEEGVGRALPGPEDHGGGLLRPRHGAEGGLDEPSLDVGCVDRDREHLDRRCVAARANVRSSCVSSAKPSARSAKSNSSTGGSPAAR